MQRARQWQAIDGVLLVDKPQGPSSNSVLQHVRRIYNAEKAGHGGTLDPMATGLLIVCFGEATKYASGLLESEKKYSGTIVLGIRTSTADAEGEVIERAPVQVSAENLARARNSLLGEIEQIPPAFSALKIEGKPAYKYAREGEPVAVQSRRVTIHTFELKPISESRVEFEVHCSSGTYVRTLAEDLGKALGTVAHLGSLRRLASGPFDVSNAHTPEALVAKSQEERLEALQSVDATLYNLPALCLEEARVSALLQGKSVGLTDQKVGKTRLYTPDGRFAGVVDVRPGNVVAPVRMMRALGSPGARKHER